MDRGVSVISPIAHSHPIFCRAPDVGRHFENWMELDLALIDASEAVYVLTLDGYQQSRGVKAEVEHARATGKPVVFIDRDGEICAGSVG
jgi:hypothetical protein